MLFCVQIPERYNHLEVVGKGSYGVVCSAIDDRRNTPVAIKKITPMAAHRYSSTIIFLFAAVCTHIHMYEFPGYFFENILKIEHVCCSLSLVYNATAVILRMYDMYAVSLVVTPSPWICCVPLRKQLSPADLRHSCMLYDICCKET